MREAIDRVRGRKEIRSTQGQPFDSVVAEMLIEPRPPCGAHGVTGLQHRLEPRSKTATNKTEMAAMLARHQLENGIRLPVTLGAEHDPFIGPLHGISPESLPFSRLVTHGGVTSTAIPFQSTMSWPGMTGGRETVRSSFRDGPPDREASYSFGNSSPMAR